MDPISWSSGLIDHLVEILKTGILLTDNQGWIRLTNRLADMLLGYPQDYLIGKSIETLFLPDDNHIFLPNIMKLTREEVGFDGEVLLRKKDGSPIFVNCSTALYKEKFTGHELLIFALQDITPFKRIEQKQFEAERFAGLGMMTEQLSHQIRNPITAIGGFALRLAKDQISPNEFTEYSKIIHQESKRLEYIIDRLIEFTHVHSDHFSGLMLDNVFGEVRKVFRVELERTPRRIIFPEPSTLPPTLFYGDLALISQATRCIIQNGLEASSNEDTIMVTGAIIQNQVQIQVQDPGDGILSQNLPFIFDPFFSTKFNFLGLGLTLAKRIAQIHKGHIEVESNLPKGTRVHLILPLDRRREIRTKLLQKNHQP